MKKSKKHSVPLLITLCAVIILTFSSLSSCSGASSDTSSSDARRIAALESRIAALQADKTLLESEYMEGINELESQIAALRAQMGSTTSSSPSSSSSANPEKFNFEYKIENEQVIITAYTGNVSDLIIPASIDGYPVTAIADNAFENSSLVSVSMPETLKSIGWFAFSGSARLERIIIPKNVAEIGYNAFYNTHSPVIYAPQGSYAYQYAKSYGLRVAEE